MSDDDILDLAIKSKRDFFDGVYYQFNTDSLLIFARAIAAKEHDAIFKVCEEIKDKYYESEYYTLMELRSDAETGIQDCLNSIRSRGEP